MRKLLKIGDEFKVKFGTNGSQKARLLVGWKRGKHGWYVTAEKYVVRSKRWTKPVKVYAADIIA